MTQQLTHNDNIVTLPFVFAARQSDPEPARDPDRFGRILGASPAMQAAYPMIAKVAPTDATVFVIGESGSGKEVAARTVHELSERASRPFVAMNCGAIPRT